MADEIKIRTRGNKFDNRARFFIGRRNVTNQVDKALIILDRENPTEIILSLKPKKIEVDVKAVNSKNIFQKMIDKFVGEKDEKDEKCTDGTCRIDSKSRGK